MALVIGNQSIERVLIIDDSEEAREGYGYPIEEMGLQPIYEENQLDNMKKALGILLKRADALVCDYHLRKKNYAAFNGDQLVADANRQKFPALLCTTYTDTETSLMRSRRRFIPALLKPETYNPETILKALIKCVKENNGEFEPSRRPWRSLVRVEQVEKREKYFYVVVPGWSSDQKVRIYMEDLPPKFRRKVKEGKRFHAQVNIGAEKPEDLFFDEWESK